MLRPNLSSLSALTYLLSATDDGGGAGVEPEAFCLKAGALDHSPVLAFLRNAIEGNCSASSNLLWWSIVTERIVKCGLKV